MSYTLMSKPGPERDANAISLYGAGDQVGRSQYESEIGSFCSPSPSAPTTYNCGAPVRSDIKAICVPLGDHVQVVSAVGGFVSARTFPPSPFSSIVLRTSTSLVLKARGPPTAGATCGMEIFPPF